LWFCTSTICYIWVISEEDEMGEACGMCGSKWKYMQSFDGEA